MFTGIIRHDSRVLDIEKGFGQTSIKFSLPQNLSLKQGDSISVNGVCLTLNKKDKKSFTANVMHETFNKTTLGNLVKNTPVNLEPAAKLGDKLDGHLVQGHIDTTGKIEAVNKKENDVVVVVSFSEKFTALVVEKGSITVDGISLTAFDVGKSKFSVSLVDYTLDNTNARFWRSGQKVNLEFDIIGKYVSRLLGKV